MPKKSSNKPDAVNLTVLVRSVEYVLGVLSFNTLKEEFSYHFSYPANAPKEQLNCDTGQLTARLHHITWHQNVVHIKREDDIAFERVELSSGPLFCENPVVTPIYVESLYFLDTEPCLCPADQFPFWKGSQTQRILNLKDTDGFSIIYFLVPSSTTTAELLLGLQFPEVPSGMDVSPCLVGLCDEQHLAGRITLWNNWDFIVVASPYTCRIKSSIPEELKKGYRLPNYKNAQSALTDLLMQAYNLIKVDGKLVKQS